MNLIEWIVTIIFMTEFLFGICANIFIILVNAINCIKRREVSSADRIITGLAISRIGLLLSMLINWHSIAFTEDEYRIQTKALGHITWTVNNHLSNWFGTILSMLYLFKIANFSNPLFLRLKRKIESVLLMMLSWTFLFFVSYLGVININKTAWESGCGGNITLKNKEKDTTSLKNIHLFILINAIPHCISLICILLLIYSLCKHLRNMKYYGKRCQDPSTMAHKKALQTLFSFLLLYATYILCVTISSWSSHNGLLFLVCIAIGAIYPTGHSFILIWGNQKLKQTLLLFLKQVRYCHKK